VILPRNFLAQGAHKDTAEIAGETRIVVGQNANVHNQLF
jgi:hypothetical protein